MLLSFSKMNDSRVRHHVPKHKYTECENAFLDLCEARGWEHIFPSELDANDKNKHIRVYTKQALVNHITTHLQISRMSSIKYACMCNFSSYSNGILYGRKQKRKSEKSYY